jgi:hypothetical protein
MVHRSQSCRQLDFLLRSCSKVLHARMQAVDVQQIWSTMELARAYACLRYMLVPASITAVF